MTVWLGKQLFCQASNPSARQTELGKQPLEALLLAQDKHQAAWLQADAVLHFGTHGSLEFMPGKQVGMSGMCFPDSLISSIPNIYYYAANNPSEATIAKRRSYANTISYLTPPAENAGLYKGLKVPFTSFASAV